MKKFLTTLTIFVALACTLATAAPVNTNKQGLAIKGYDPVAYFTQSKPTKGKAEFSTNHQGATYRFSSAQNLSAFKKNPKKYTPAYGGYCAFGVSKGKLISINPKVYSIHKGRLLLQVNRKFAKKFAQDFDSNVALADQNWKTLSK